MNPVITKLQLVTRPSDKIYEVRWLEDGKAKRKSTGTRDKKTATITAVQIEADIRAPRVPNAPTVGWLIDSYLSTKKKQNTDRSYTSIEVSLRPVKARLGDLRWDQLTQDRIDDYVEQRLKDVRWKDHPNKRPDSSKTVGHATVSRDLRILRAVISTAFAARHIPSQIKFKINAKQSRPKEVYLTKTEVAMMLDACEPKRQTNADGRVVYRRRNREHLYKFILISIASAARKEAVLSLTWDQIHFPSDADLKGEKLVDLASRKVAGNTYIDFGEGSGNKRRPVMPIGDNFRLMWELVTTRPALSTQDEFDEDCSENRVITFNGRPIQDLKKGFAELVKECGITKKVTPHSLKHTAVTWMVQAGIPLATISDLTNTSEKILRKVYSHHRPDYQEELGSALSI